MLLKNKKILISGLANKYSIATGIAYAMHREGAELAFTYQNERLLKNLKPIANECASNILIECDVSNDHSIKSTFVPRGILVSYGKLSVLLDCRGVNECVILACTAGVDE